MSRECYVSTSTERAKRPPANSRRRLSGPGLRKLCLLSYLHSRSLTESAHPGLSWSSSLSLTDLSRCLRSQSPPPLQPRVSWPLLISHPALSACIVSRYNSKSLHRCTPQSPGHQRNLRPGVFYLTLAVNSH